MTAVLYVYLVPGFCTKVNFRIGIKGINSSVNFLIYCYFNNSFRAQLTSSLAVILVFFKAKSCVNQSTAIYQDTRNNTTPNTKPRDMSYIGSIELIERA